MRIKSLMVLIVLFILFSKPVVAQYLTSSDKAMMKYTDSGVKVVFRKPVRMVVLDRISQSPSGLIPWLEEVTEGYAAYPDPFAFSANESNPKIYPGYPLYDPDAICMYLHVSDASGNDKVKIPLKQRLGVAWNMAGFYGEHFVSLSEVWRREGLMREAYVNLESGDAWTLATEKSGDPSVAPSPDGKKLLVLCREVVYVDGKMVHPYYDENGLRLDILPPDKFKTQSTRIKEWEKSHPNRLRFSTNKTVAWSPDSCYVAITASINERISKSHTVSRPRLLIIDTSRLGPEKQVQEYSAVIPIAATGEYNISTGPRVWDATQETITVTGYLNNHNIQVKVSYKDALPSSETK